MRQILFQLFLLVAAVPALAEEPTLLVQHHEPRGLDEEVLSRATVVAGLSDGRIVVSSDDVGYVVAANRKKVTKIEGHPKVDAVQKTRIVPLGPRGFLAFMFDAANGMTIARFDSAKLEWAAVERPLGFVLGEHSTLPDGRAVFGQPRKAWFVFEPAVNAFRAHDIPSELGACSGTMGRISKTEVIDVGPGTSGPCSLAFDAATGRWREAPPPPRAACDAATIFDGKKLYVLGGRQKCKRGNPSDEVGAMVYDAKAATWQVLPDGPGSLSADAVGAAHAGHWVATWRFTQDGLSLLAFDTKKQAWTSATVPLELLALRSSEISPGKWVIAGKNTAAERANRSVLLEVALTARPSARELERQAKVIEEFTTPPPAAQIDWSTVSEKERQAAIREGKGSVERWMPASFDPKTKMKRKNGYWVFALGESAVTWDVNPSKCKSFIEGLHKKWPTRTVGSSEWEVELGDGFARFKRKYLYGPQPACELKSECEADYSMVMHTPLSLVGPFFSFSEVTSAVQNCGDATQTEVVRAVDLRSGKDAAPEDMVSEPSLLEALKRTRPLREALRDAKTWADAKTALTSVDPHGFKAFSFTDWDPRKKLVGLRLNYSDPKTGQLAFVDVWVTPREEMVEFFEKAARGEGFYLGNRRM